MSEARRRAPVNPPVPAVTPAMSLDPYGPLMHTSTVSSPTLESATVEN